MFPTLILPHPLSFSTSPTGVEFFHFNSSHRGFLPMNDVITRPVPMKSRSKIMIPSILSHTSAKLNVASTIEILSSDWRSRKWANAILEQRSKALGWIRRILLYKLQQSVRNNVSNLSPSVNLRDSVTTAFSVEFVIDSFSRSSAPSTLVIE